MVTNERYKRLVALILVMATCVAPWTAARGGDWMPMLPNQDFYDFQLFAPPDLQDYEIYPEASEGIYFNYDRIYWGITPPRVAGVATTEVGSSLIPTSPISAESIVQLNNNAIQASGTANTNIIGGVYTFGSDPLQLDLNTSWMRTKMGWGNRYEGGWIYDNRGVHISYFAIDQSQSYQTNSEFAASSPTQTFLQTSASGGGGVAGGGGFGNVSNALISNSTVTSSPPPDHIIAQKLTQDQNTEIMSAGVASTIRRELGRRGSGTTARFGLGPRFMQFADRYNLGYESNQYAFNRGPTGTTGGTGGGVGGGGGAGGTTGGGGIGGGGGGTTGGGTTGGGTTGGGGTTAGGGGTTAGGGGTTAGGLGGTGSQSILVNNSAGDVLGISGYDTLTGRGLGSPLQVGAWNTSTFNNMVGPEFAMMFESQQGRWLWTSEFKFTAGFNWQNNLYNGANFPNTLGADYLRATFQLSNAPQTQTSAQTGGSTQQPPPPPMFIQLYGIGQNNAVNRAEHRFVFTPIGEWRLGTEFRVSEAIRLRAGYTGMWLGSIARASTNTGYVTRDAPVKFAAPQDPSQTASLTNPWVVKLTGDNPTNPAFVNGAPNPYFVPSPRYNSIGPVNGGQEYVFTNGVDFGIEVRY
jgi:hypothetical protein